jgi:Ca2+-binding RTX toxin-like protein
MEGGNNISITANSLDNQIDTNNGSNAVTTLSGNDTINLKADSVWGGDYVAKNMSNSLSIGTNEKISINGLNSFSDVIDGGADIDTLNLTTGNDAFFIDDVYSDTHNSLALASTTQGIDSIARVASLEVINAGDGNDIVDLTSNNFVLAEAVVINGEAGNDNLWGSNGNDVIDGGIGDDSIFGGTGSDTLTGGTGSDIFQFTATAGSDIITDFDVSGGGDLIKLYYRAEDNHTNTNLSLASGVLTWDVDATNSDVVIDMSATVSSSDLNSLDVLITFVEIV